MPGLTSYVVPEDGVYMKENLSGETVQIGRYQANAPGNTNKMQPVPEAFLTKGIEFLDMCNRQCLRIRKQFPVCSQPNMYF